MSGAEQVPHHLCLVHSIGLHKHISVAVAIFVTRASIQHFCPFPLPVPRSRGQLLISTAASHCSPIPSVGAIASRYLAVTSLFKAS